MKINIKNTIKSILSFFGIKITREFKIIPLFKKNVFHKKYKKRVLISYLTEPFIKSNNFSHTNLLECYTAGKIFDELCFCVDVIDHSSNKKIDYSKYDVIYGMGNALEKSFYMNHDKLIRIFYSPGCNPVYSNTETLLKVREFYNAHGERMLSSSRFMEQNYELQILLSDGVIVLGNDFVLDTYKKFDKHRLERYEKMNAFFYDINNIDLSKKNIEETRKNFLWFGSSGLLHKGLDLLIEIFSKNQDITLHICGAPKIEKCFLDYYNQTLIESKNIINHGFIDIRSENFKEIMGQCAFTIFPSVSEGGAPATLNTIANGGLIPIITRSAGLDIDNFGIIIEKPELKYVNEAIEKALLLDNAQILNMSILAKTNIRDNYTYNIYKKNLNNLIKKILFKIK